MLNHDALNFALEALKISGAKVAILVASGPGPKKSQSEDSLIDTIAAASADTVCIGATVDGEVVFDIFFVNGIPSHYQIREAWESLPFDGITVKNSSINTYHVVTGFNIDGMSNTDGLTIESTHKEPLLAVARKAMDNRTNQKGLDYVAVVQVNDTFYRLWTDGCGAWYYRNSGDDCIPA